MHRRHKYDIIVILGIVGLSVSLYLTVTGSLGLTVPCGITGGCNDVLNSQYAKVAGVPLSVLGTIYFSTAIVAALLANHYPSWRRLLTWLLGIGAVVALLFLFIQFFILRRVCQYCLVTDGLAIIMFLWDLNIEHHSPALAPEQ